MSWKIEFYNKDVENQIYKFPEKIQAKLLDIMEIMTAKKRMVEVKNG